MFKYKIIFFILLTAVLASGKAYCQEGILDKEIQGKTQDLQINTVAGKVAYVGPESNVIDVRTNKGQEMFFISPESMLYRHTHHIASLEIYKGDPVTIQYTVSSSGKNIIIKLIDNKSHSI